MFCTNCGNEINKGLKYCPYCGALLDSNIYNNVVPFEINNNETIDPIQELEEKETAIFSYIFYISVIFSAVMLLLTIVCFNKYIAISGMIGCLACFVLSIIDNKKTKSKYSVLSAIISITFAFAIFCIFYMSLFIK